MNPTSNNEPTITEDNPLPFKIKVKLLSNETYEFQVSKDMLVKDFKQHITQTVKVPIERMRIVFAGKQLIDDKPLSEFVPETGMTVHLIARSAESMQQPPQQSQSSQSQNQPRQQQQQQQQPPQQNPMDGIMNMVNQMMGGIGAQGNQIPQVQMAFGSMGQQGGSGQPPNLNNILSGLFRPPTQNQESSRSQGQNPNSNSQNLPQSSQQPQNQSQPSQSQSLPQNQHPPHHHHHVHNHGNNSQNSQRIPYAPISLLSQQLAGLNLPLDNVTTEQQVLNRDALTRYLRRLHHQSTRVLMQVNRLIGLMENGNYSHMNEFVPIFRALNQANSVAVDCITRLHHQQHHRPNNAQSVSQPNNSSVSPSQETQQIRNQVPQQQPPQQPPQQPQQPQQMPVNPLNMFQMMMQNRPQQPQQQPQTQQSQPSRQSPQQGGLPMMGGLDLGALLGGMGGMGGMGNLLNMKLSELFQQENEPSMLTTLLCDINGNHILQAFTARNFSFLDEQHPSIRENLKKLIEQQGQQKIEDELVNSLSSFLVPKEQFQGQFDDYEKCAEECRKNLKAGVKNWIKCTLPEKPERYSNDVTMIVKTVFYQNISTMSRMSRAKQDEVGLRIFKTQVIATLDPFIPGLSGMLYSIIEQRDIIRIFNEFRQEEQRRAQMSEEQTQSEERLIEMIKEVGKRDSKSLAETPHSEEYSRKQ